MSWQVGTLALVLLVVGAGMIWYERTRPPSQIVALVAVLAALAVAGRIVLAPIPNVVATTDIVFFAGFALGPAPGFAVGALGGLISNFWLGQGVWTPWQMVGWGMTGVAGGVFFHLTRGKAGRLKLAAACGAAGLVFGMWMNFQTMVSFGGEVSLDRYLALEVRAIPFDLAHITGNVIFALAAGPAMVAALTRFRERFEWQKVPSVAGLLLVMVGLGTIVFAPPAEAAVNDETGQARSWLRTQQNDDGGFAVSPGGESSVLITLRAMLGLAAADLNPLDVRTDGRSPLALIRAERREITDANEIALAVLGLRTVGEDPRDFEGRNLVAALERRRGADNSFGNKVNVAAFAALAFRSAGAKGSEAATTKWLRSAQNLSTDGGWGISPQAPSDADSTGTVLQVIDGQSAVARAMDFLRSVQTSSGGFASNAIVNSQSTGLVLQGLAALGKSHASLRKGGNTGLDFLEARQQSDGSIWYSRSSDQTRVWVTADALVGLAGRSLPVSEPPRQAQPDSPSGNGSNPGSTEGFVPGLVPSTGSAASGGNATSPDTPIGSGVGQPLDPPVSGGIDPLPSAPELAPVIPEPPTAALLAASAAGPEPSPISAILVFLLVSGGLAGGTILLARRYRW
ncbi:MAG: prenyltransferase/squalene oxidase repeat-containing protein [Solirubrobacterales bacterium]